MKTLEKESKNIRDQIGRLEKEREDIQNNLDNISDVSTETKEEKEIRIWSEVRVQVLDSYIKTAKTELRAINPTQKEDNKMNEQETLEKERQDIIDKIEELQKKHIKSIFEIALDAKEKEINRTKELIITLHKTETTTRNDRKKLELDLQSSLDQMTDLEKQYINL